MALAQRLNELAVANSEGLLNDDEYRLLRQSMFEQHSGNTNIPVESPLVSITATHVHRGSASKAFTSRLPTSKPIVDQHNSTSDHRKSTPCRAKPSATISMVNLLRKAIGRKPPAAVHETSLAKDTYRNDIPKRSILVPRLLHRKRPGLPPLLTDSSMMLPNSSHLSNTRSENDRPPLSLIVPPSPSIRETVISGVFDGDNLTTTEDIRTALTTSEDEARKLVDAFNDLEASALRRFQRQDAHRLPVIMSNANVLLEGREWREHRLITSHSSPVLDFKERYILNSADSTGDSMSIRSGSSHKTSLSQAKSTSSLRKYPPSSPLSPHFHTPSIAPARKNSISSNSSQRTSDNSIPMLAVTVSSGALSRSMSHLALPKFEGNTECASMDSIGLEDGGDESEIFDIRRRREELVTRYTARLEFLRAKLKSAELHEKLLRK